MLLGKIKHPNKLLCKKEELLDIISDQKIEILLTMGAGDIDQLVEKIVQLFNNDSVVINENGLTR